MPRYEGDVSEYTSRRRTATRLVVEQPDLIRESLSKVPGDATGGGFRDAGGRQVLATRLPDLSDTVSAAAVLDALKSRASASLSPW